ncbi:MAG: glycosyltransferase family 2 protein, partial [Elusimicrobiota bacterium]
MPLHIVCCAYNEAKAIGDLFTQIGILAKDIPVTLTFVDDGSTDASADIITRTQPTYKTVLLRNLHNQGLGASLRKALAQAIKSCTDTDAIATLDADMTHPPQMLATMLRRMAQDGCDIVIGSRFTGAGSGESGVPAIRRCCAAIARTIFRLRFRPIASIGDPTTGLRCYKASILKKLLKADGSLDLSSQGFAIQLEILLKLCDSGATVTEV